ncbi:MAG: isomerizing glutamine--fructose-6-phosphate transaminase [Eubacteriales bacterium]|nr:isomerizing glutamine--fructose-6-phosphate transaminase [Eubacteriales bacterium]
MCGIISIKGKNAVKKTISGLKKLEYRGYDSCGIAWKNKKLNIKKSKGYISILEEKVKNIKSELTIGHTRWATHGVPSELNSHPHVSMDGKFMCVHNGIIENYKELKKQFLQGYEFYSDTDTEVIPNLVSKFYKDLVNCNPSCCNRRRNSKYSGECYGSKCKCASYCDDILTAFKMAIDQLKGSFAIVLINDYNDKIYFARHSSPMVISKTKDMIICSDINGLDDKSNTFYLPDDTYGVLDNDFEVFDTNSKPIAIKYSNYKGGIENKLSGYKHYMLKEIYEIPNAIELTKDALYGTSLTLPKNISQILFVSCGTSYHASLMAKKYIENFAHIPCECVIASEFVSSNNLILPNTLGVFISQSGETADTLKSLEKAKSQGVYTLAITNVQNSHITLIADTTVLMRAGAEICVASTKAYTTQLFVLLQLTNYLIGLQQGNFRIISEKIQSKKQDKVSEGKISKANTGGSATELVEVLSKQDCLGISSDDIANLTGLDISTIDKQLDNLVDKIYLHKQFHLIGKDYDYITAMEGSLKIKEISYIFTDAYPCGELKHGTLSLIDENSIVFVIMTERDLIAKTTNAIHEITSRGGNVVCITQFDDIDLSDCYYVIHLPKLNQLFMPIVSIIPFHLISYKITTKLGLNPDKPRNLAKSVTVE